jgi:hypothetical protein
MTDSQTGDVRHIGGDAKDLNEILMTFAQARRARAARRAALFTYAIRPG